MRHVRPLVAVCALALATAAQAQIGAGYLATQMDVAVKNFDIADKNHDGLLTKEEAAKGPVPFIRAHFDEIDKAKRGTVSKQDVIDYIRAMQNPASRKPAPAAAGSTP
ncbi:EF-hand domain-containing protein [Dyella jiangningensis]|uniref:EF-hand domain-containing protein n=1 Tax=Dyella jiangningensis TaxID=1379159 RepID=UPI002410684C|nr:EF-hand domain-containing protein [Dyella jiangningensis]MDG2538513.1 EF-hand domain-containing protein [Dyella jiangningensis]